MAGPAVGLTPTADRMNLKPPAKSTYSLYSRLAEDRCDADHGELIDHLIMRWVLVIAHRRQQA